MKAMMKRMGIDSEEVEDVEEVVIKTKSKDMVIRDAAVTIMTVQGQKTFQIVGEPEIREKVAEVSSEILEEDISLVVEQTGVSKEEARKVLKECNGQPAEAILKIISSR